MSNKIDRDKMEHVTNCDECGKVVHIADLRPKIKGDNTILVCEECK